MRNQKKKTGFIFVVSGPSGSGKTTLAKRILKRSKFKNKFARSVSFTTRPKRPGERQGCDYIFVAAEEFRKLLKAKKILEHTRYLGYDYGTSRSFLKQAIRQGLNVMLCLDTKGALFLKKEYPQRAIIIFVKPPSLEIAKQRILGRCAKTKSKEVNRRIQIASKELKYINRYDYCLVNDNLSQAIKEMERIIQWVISQ